MENFVRVGDTEILPPPSSLKSTPTVPETVQVTYPLNVY